MEWYSDVFDIVFKDVDAARAEEMWASKIRSSAKGAEGGESGSRAEEDEVEK